MYGVLNMLSEYTYFYIARNITSYTFVEKLLKLFSHTVKVIKWESDRPVFKTIYTLKT